MAVSWLIRCDYLGISAGVNQSAKGHENLNVMQIGESEQKQETNSKGQRSMTEVKILLNKR